jgi:tellurite resistance protein
MDKKTIEYYYDGNYSFAISKDANGHKVGMLKDVHTGTVLAESVPQKVLPENVENLLNVAKIIINAAWQDGTIHPDERKAFDKAFEDVAFTPQQLATLDAEFAKPSPLASLLPQVTTREDKLLILETSLLLVVADNEFHPSEKAFIEKLIDAFKLDAGDYGLLYLMLPQRVKKYIVKESLHETLEMKADEIKVLDKLTEAPSEEVTIDHEMVYVKLISNWKNRAARYQRVKSY